ncbi:MAG: XamI family restriction endonuclease [Chloroflexi bacterium]|nr:MAG: XamI family restriction endonuclease [Chloroflexota bacterium]
MAVNADKTNIWKADIAQSVDMYNDWFVNFAPKVYRETRRRTTEDVENALKWTTNLTNIEPMLLRQFPEILPMLRMTTAPPIARDRLVGLARVSKNLVENMEIDKRLPPKMSSVLIEAELKKIGQIIVRLADRDLFPWLEDNHLPSEKELYRAATIVADRLCGAATDPIIRNAQEQRQLKAISGWLNQRGYKQVSGGNDSSVSDMQLGTYSFRRNVPVTMENERIVKIPIDTVIMPLSAYPSEFPLLIEAKSAGDFTNTNKRRKEEAAKYFQLKRTYCERIRFVLFLCGYFDAGYLGYEASEGIDWVWEHRIDDLTKFGV